MKKLLSSEVLKYLFFGVLATFVYVRAHLIIFALTQSAAISVVVANVIAIVFAFFTNDYFVLNQVRTGWLNHLVEFSVARLSALVLDLISAYLLVTKFPRVTGQFVNDNISLINMIGTIFSQVLVIVSDYVFGRLLTFKDKK